MSMSEYHIEVLAKFARCSFDHSLIRHYQGNGGPAYLSKSLQFLHRAAQKRKKALWSLFFSLFLLGVGISPFLDGGFGMSFESIVGYTLSLTALVVSCWGIRTLRQANEEWCCGALGYGGRNFFLLLEKLTRFLYPDNDNQCSHICGALEVPTHNTLKKLLTLKASEALLLQNPSMEDALRERERRGSFWKGCYPETLMEIVSVCYELGLISSHDAQPHFDAAWELLRKTVKTHAKEKVIAVLAEGADRLEQSELPATPLPTKRSSGDSQSARNIEASMNS